MDLGLAGKTIDEVEPGFTVGIVISDDNYISLDSPFSVSTSTGTVRIDPEKNSPEDHAALEFLVGQSIVAGSAGDDGSLSLSLADGTVLHSAPDGEYEPWNFVGPKGFRVVAMPSGSLMVWSAEPGSTV